jgi:dephospho-CoA kinase
MTRRRLHPHKVRPRRWPSRIVGLTGSIAMGKSTATSFLARAGIPVFSADAAVHKMLGPRGIAVGPVTERFPGVTTDKGVDRAALGKAVFGDPAALAALEAILHPLVKNARAHFFQAAALKRHGIVAVEIPLLFETPQNDLFDMIAVVSAPAFLQRQRALRRPGMTAEKLKAILARQMPDTKKRRLADVVIPSGLGKRETLRRLTRALKSRLGSGGDS